MEQMIQRLDAENERKDTNMNGERRGRLCRHNFIGGFDIKVLICYLQYMFIP